MSHPFEKFVANITSYVPENAYALSEAANLAYANEADIVKTAKTWGFNHVKFIDIKNTQLFIASNETHIVIAFRGTEPTNIKDWLNNTKIRLTKGPFDTQVHRGFLAALKHVWPQILAEVSLQQNMGQSLWLTGHSLGAALALLCTAYFRDHGFKIGDPIDKPVNGTYLFGSPRVGDKDFEQKLEADAGSRIFRFVNNNDMVTRVPPRSLGYSHVGKLLYFSEDGKSLEIDASYWYRFLELFKGVFEDFGDLGPDQFKDHAMTEYMSRTKLHRNNNPFK